MAQPHRHRRHQRVREATSPRYSPSPSPPPAVISTTVGLAVTLHVSAAISNFLITEYVVNFEQRATEVMVNPFKVESSHLTVPSGRGSALS